MNLEEMKERQKRIRNFDYCAYRPREVNVGRSYFARTDTVADREMQDQLLDSMDLERERGITIKIKCRRINI